MGARIHLRWRRRRALPAALLSVAASFAFVGAGSARVTVSLSLAASDTTPAPGAIVTLTATATGGIEGYRVRFVNGDTAFATVPLQSGSASATISLPAGTYTIKALYLTATGIPTATSNLVTLVVGETPLNTTVTTLETTAVVAGEVATFTARVARQDGGLPLPTGSVTFYDQDVPMAGSVPLVDGAAVLQQGGFAPGTTHSFTARYSGDAGNLPSSSTGIVRAIEAISSIQTTIEVVASPEVVRPGASASLTAHVAQVGGTATPPAGADVAFWNIDGDTTVFLGTSSLGADGWTTTPLSLGNRPAGSYTIRATYAGDATFASASASTTVRYTAPATVTAPSAAIVYGEPIPAFEPSYDGVGSPATPASCSTTATGSSPAGTYPVTCTGAADPGYSFGYVDGELTIAKAPLRVTGVDATSAVGESPTLAATLSGFVAGETMATSDVTGAASCTASPGSGPGTYPIVCTIGTLASDRYAFTGFVDGTLTVVAARSLAVTAPSPTMRYGDALPPLTPTYAGFAPGDDAASLVTAPTCTTTATATSDPGAYPVDCSGGSDARYAFTYASGTLTIVKADSQLELVAPRIAPVGRSVRLVAVVRAGLRTIANVPVTITLAGESCTDTTNLLGVAACTLTPTGPTGPSTATATFAGNAGYAASSDTAPVLLYAYPNGGSFVIGDRSAGAQARQDIDKAQELDAEIGVAGSPAHEPFLPPCG